MADLQNIPLLDSFKTTLEQEYDGNTGTMFLGQVPDITLETGQKLFLCIEPTNSTNKQVVEIDAINPVARTVNVSSVGVKKGQGINYGSIPHNQGVQVIISNNYQYFENIRTVVNSKLDKGGLRSALTGIWNLFYSDGSGVETRLGFGANGSYLKSIGPNGRPVWDNPPLDINGQTTETNPSGSDTVPLFDGTNKKVSLSNLTKGLDLANSSRKGIVEMASDSEASTGTDQIRYINPDQLLKNMPRTPATTNFAIANAEFPATSYTTNSTSFVTVDSFTSVTGGVYRVVFDIQGTSGADALHQIVVNGSIQAEFETSGALIQNNIFFINVGRGNTVSIQLRTSNGSFQARLHGYNITSN